MSRNKGCKYLMFIDETGISEEKYTPFTVTGAIFTYAYMNELQNKINDFKLKCFGRNDFGFHLKAILQGEKPYRKEDGVTLEHLQTFWNELPIFLASIDFKIISITVDKKKLEEYYITPKDPYVVAFAHIMKSFYSLLSHPKAINARIIFESRDDHQNFMVQKAFFDIYNSGTVHLDVEPFKGKVKGFIFAPKNEPQYQAGLEIADLISNPLSRARRGIKEVNPRFINYGNDNKIFKALKDKIYIGDTSHDIRNWGFKQVPIIKKKRNWVDNPATI